MEIKPTNIENNEKEDKSLKQQDTNKNENVDQDLRNEVISLEQEIAKLKDSLLREKAENENIRRRNAKEIVETNNFAISNFARDLTETLENFIRALNNIDKENFANNKEMSTFTEGVEMTFKNMQNCFEKYGVKRINPIGQQFDHNLHQAISNVIDDTKKDNEVVNVIQAGYTIKNRLLKPAMVIVNKKGNID